MGRRVAAIALLLSVTLAAQSPLTRHASNVSALIAYPAYYHLRPVTIAGTLTRNSNGRLQLEGAPAMHIVFGAHVQDGLNEIRGDFWDLGRLRADDPRLASMNLQQTFQIDPDNWPRPGQVLAIVASAIAPASAPATASIRSMVLFPSRYLDQKVTVTGQFAGRNLLGDLPDAPGRSQYDFVLRSADAAIWVTNLRPRGRDFELSLDTRIDTGRWIEISGTLQQARGLQWINAEGSRVALTRAAVETAEAEPVPAPPARPPEVLFSVPTEGESDVPQNVAVRIQFSRDLDPSTLKDRVRVRYLDEEARLLGEPDTPVAVFTVQYQAPNRVLELKFSDPLVRYRTIKVDLLPGILGTDKQPLTPTPWTLSFVTAGAF